MSFNIFIYIIKFVMSQSTNQSFLIKILTFFIETTKTHKKKIIFLILLALGVKLIKNRVKFNHLIYLAEKALKIVQYLPLPQVQGFRNIQKFQYYDNQPLKQIQNLIKIEQIKAKIKRKQEGSWNQLKHQTISGIVISLCMYNFNNFINIVQDKYLEDFKLLKYEQYFYQFLNRIKIKFIESLTISFEIVKQMLYQSIAQLGLKQRFNLTQYEDLFNRFVDIIFEGKYNYHDEHHEKYIHKKIKSKKGKNGVVYDLFYTEMETKIDHSLIKKPVRTTRKIGNALSFIYNSTKAILTLPLKILNYVPEPIEQITAERFKINKVLYKLPIKKVDLGEMKGDEQPYLFSKIILGQIQEIVDSLNFQTLVFEYSNLNTKIFMNRLKIYMHKNRIKELQVAQFLAVGFKIMKQQITIERSRRQVFYDLEILKALKTVNRSSMKNKSEGLKTILEEGQNQEQLPECQQIMQQQQHDIKNSILEEIYAFNEFIYLQKQFQLKYYHERSQIEIPIKSNNHQTKSQDDDLENMLNMISK